MPQTRTRRAVRVCAAGERSRADDRHRRATDRVVERPHAHLGRDGRVGQDDVESRAIYDLLEQEIVPLFYARGSDGLPRGWLRMMKRSISSNCPFFNTNRPEDLSQAEAMPAGSR